MPDEPSALRLAWMIALIVASRGVFAECGGKHVFTARMGKPMQNVGHLAKDFLKSEAGPTATEYAAMLAWIQRESVAIR